MTGDEKREWSEGVTEHGIAGDRLSLFDAILDAPETKIPTHYGKRGSVRGQAVCGSGLGQRTGTHDLVTCPTCRKHVSKLERRKR